MRTRNECHVISDLAILKLLAFRTTYLCEEALSKLIIVKSENRYFLKYVENILRCHVSIYEWMVCEKLSSASIPLVALDNFHKVNFVNFFRLAISITWYFYYCRVTFVDCALCIISP